MGTLGQLSNSGREGKCIECALVMRSVKEYNQFTLQLIEYSHTQQSESEGFHGITECYPLPNSHARSDHEPSGGLSGSFFSPALRFNLQG